MRSTKVGEMRKSTRLAISVLALFCALTASANAEMRHGLSAFGDLKYPADFKHFEYVNLDAPKGGHLRTLSTSSIQTFDNFNLVIRKNNRAEGLELLFDSLMARALDEPDAVYGLVAHSAELSSDKKYVTFYLRAEAKFRDGTPVTADDVVFSYSALRDKEFADPRYYVMLQDVVKVEALDAHTVRYEFQGNNLRDLPTTVATLPILSKAYYSKVPVGRASLEPPLGSGPYEISAFRPGMNIVYKRRADYWGRDLPVNRGRFNFDEIRYEYFRERTAAFEAFKAGVYDLREEFTSKVWATEYKIRQVDSGKIRLLTIVDGKPSGAQGFFINTRREKFTDRRVRKALDYAFDFEWVNRNLFFNLYKRTDSFFVNSDLMATGLPSEAELKLLEPFRDKLPPEVFTELYIPPVTDGSGNDREKLLIASRLLDEAGWRVNESGARVNAKNEPFTIELMLDDPVWEKVLGFYAEKLRMLGISISIRLVDAAQYQERMKTFDFDIDTSRFSFEPTPGPGIKNFFSSASAKFPGSLNLAGISDPVVDALTDKMLSAQNRDDMRTAAHALDRVLRAGHYWVPQWYKTSHNLAFWDRYSWPAIKPKYDRGVEDTWWYDPAKAAELDSKK
jgi:microcin C transport system substrate-binding protein